MKKPPKSQSGPLGMQRLRALALARLGELGKTSSYTGAAALFKRRGLSSQLSLESFIQLGHRQPWYLSTSVHEISNMECGLRALIYIVATLNVNAQKDAVPEPYVIVATRGGSVCGGARGVTPLEAMKRMRQGNSALLYGVTLVSNFDLNAELANVFLNGGGKSIRYVRMALAPYIDADARNLFSTRHVNFVGLVNYHLRNVGMNFIPRIYYYRDNPVLGAVSIEEANCQVLDFQHSSIRKLGLDESLSKTRHADFAFAGAVCQASTSEHSVIIVENGAILACAGGLPDMIQTCEAALRQQQQCTAGRAWPVVALSSSEDFFSVIHKLHTVGISDVLIVSGSPPFAGTLADSRLHGIRIMWFADQKLGLVKHS